MESQSRESRERIEGVKKMNQLTEQNRTCVNRFLASYPECETCERDYNPAHYPNNLDCLRYKEMHVVGFNADTNDKTHRQEKSE